MLREGSKGAGKEMFVASLNLSGVNAQKYVPVYVGDSKGIVTLPDLTQ
jgi:hypothetical protein